MVTLTDILEVNWVILYFVYGQVFFITGLVTGLQWYRRSRLELARPLPWLAAFGLAHGLNEWGYIFIPLQAQYLPDPVVRLMIIAHLLLLAVSFFFLFQFGVELLLPAFPRRRWLRAVPAAVLVLWGLAVLLRGMWVQERLNVLFAIGDGWSRYFLCLPGSLLAHLGLLRQARRVREMGLRRIARYLVGAAVAFAIYGLVGGVVVPTAPVFPANLLNYALLDRTVHVPAPVFRSFCGLAMSFFVVRFLEVFEVERDRRIDEMEHAQLLTADRERIGRELHDGIIQNIYAAGLNLEDALHRLAQSPERARGQIQAVMGALDQTIQDIRNYIFDLQGDEVARDLESRLQELVQDLRLDTLLEVDLQIIGPRCCRPPQQLTAHFTQIAREALSNVVQHAQAGQAQVTLAYEGHQIRLVVADDGAGLEPAILETAAPDGHGIPNMQARARLLGGELAIRSAGGQGTEVTVTAPCDLSQS